jgi:hypothetical protein
MAACKGARFCPNTAIETCDKFLCSVLLEMWLYALISKSSDYRLKER